MLNDKIKEMLACPNCRGELRFDGEFRCTDAACGLRFPVVEGVPILINEKNSLFQIADFVEQRETTYRSGAARWQKQLKNLLPSISKNYKTQKNLEDFAARLRAKSEVPRLLIVGGAVEGQGMKIDSLFAGMETVETDVALVGRTELVCDAHDIPFRAETFDGVIAQAVLEHVVDPARCAEELHRVLKNGGLIYAETPFMQQVHLGRFDFTRFTHLGHRRLFRRFAEIGSGAVCGSGMALAWSYLYFLQSFCKSKTSARAVSVFAGLTAFWLKYVDYFTIDRAGSFDAASGYYFFGEKSQETLSDRELIDGYKGLI